MQNASVKGVISDLDGVVYRGDDAIPGAVEAFRRWHSSAIPYAFVTNNATKSAEAVARKLIGLGIETEAARIVTACGATGDLIGRRYPPRTEVFVIGEAALFEAVEAKGAVAVGRETGVVVLGFDAELTFAKLRTAVRSMLGGADLVVTNPDMLTPAVGGGYEPCVGAILASLLAAVPSCRPTIVGKPEATMIEDALRRLGTPREATIMIGDQVATDIVAGQRAGLRSYLVETGVPYAPIAGITPDAIIADILAIF